MTPAEIEALSDELMSARSSGRMVEPLSARPGFDLDAGYAIEARLKQLWEATGHRSVGRKVGYANKAMWRVFKLETLVWGHMYDDTVRYAENNSAILAIANPRSLKIEPEVVFGLKQPITEPGLDATAALGAVDWIALGFEIIDCPYPGWKFQPSDLVASFGLHAALVVGEKLSVTSEAIPKLAEQLAGFRLRIMKDGKLAEEGSGKNSLKSPALCLAELGAAVARRFPGEPLEAGEIISSGTLTGGHLATRGDHWAAEVEGIDLPRLDLRLT